MSPKKSETLEIRLSHALKQALKVRCRADGRSVSEAVRAMIVAHLATAEGAGLAPRRRRTALRAGIAIAAALGVGAAAAPSLARSTRQATFQAMDPGHRGRVSFDEFASVMRVRAGVGLTSDAGPIPALFHRGLEARRDILGPTLRRAILRRAFDAIDADHDGEITAEEFRRYRPD